MPTSCDWLHNVPNTARFEALQRIPIQLEPHLARADRRAALMFLRPLFQQLIGVEVDWFTGVASANPHDG